MTTAHLIHGFVGAGKTTYAAKLEQDLSAFRFSIDEWMIALYGQNPPAEKFEEYHSRTTDLVWNVASRALELDQPIILDFGFWSRASRDDARRRIQSLGAKTILYRVTCAEDTMRSRVLARTTRSLERALYIDENAIESFRKRFEPLGVDEPHTLVRTD
ncbi:MAG: ATP-binding protein [Phormidesmis sp.]